jgi:hypothetical protein
VQARGVPLGLGEQVEHAAVVPKRAGVQDEACGVDLVQDSIFNIQDSRFKIQDSRFKGDYHAKLWLRVCPRTPLNIEF